MIDLHAHVLPAVDDGPVDITGSLAITRVAVAAGTSAIAVTPHVNWDYQPTAATIARTVAETQRAIDAAGLALRLHTGAEVAVTKGD